MPRIKLRDFSGGLWVAGPADAQPATTLRRAKGVHSTPTRSVRSRWGSSFLFNVNAHSLFRFGTSRYLIDNVSIYRDGVVRTPYNGGFGRAAFARMPPQAGVVPNDLSLADYLFVAGGRTTSVGGVVNENALVKFDGNGNVSRWGIAIDNAVVTGGPFGTTFLAFPVPQGGITVGGLTIGVQDKTIDNMDATTGWSAAGTLTSGPTLDASIKQEGTNSIKFVVPASSLGGIKKSISIDLAHLTNADATQRDSPDEDWIMLDIRIDFPARLERMVLTFGLDGNFNNAYAKQLIVDDHIRNASINSPQGLANFDKRFNNIVLRET